MQPFDGDAGHVGAWRSGLGALAAMAIARSPHQPAIDKHHQGAVTHVDLLD